MPIMASGLDDPVIFEASLSPDLDHVAFGQSLASVGIWDLQADFWTIDAADANDLGPVVDIFDVTANFVWVDSDPQAKLAGAPIDELVFTVDEVLINELRITENASGNEPGGPRSEQVGTIRIVASGCSIGDRQHSERFPGRSSASGLAWCVPALRSADDTHAGHPRDGPDGQQSDVSGWSGSGRCQHGSDRLLRWSG